MYYNLIYDDYDHNDYDYYYKKYYYNSQSTSLHDAPQGMGNCF